MQNKDLILEFKDEKHEYFLGENKFIGVNSFLHDYGFDFDSQFWLHMKALEKSIDGFYGLFFKKGFNFDDRCPDIEQLIKSFNKEIKKLKIDLNKNIKEVQDEWDLSASLGTLFHKKMELKAYELGYSINPFTDKEFTVIEKPSYLLDFDNASSVNYLNSLKDGCYQELLIFIPELKIAGQADEVFIETINGKRYLDIGDHKTNSKSPKNDKKSKPLNYPIEHLYNNNYCKYWLQLSLYANMLSKYNLIPRHLGIYHYENYDEDTKKIIKFNYLKNETDNLLELRELQLSCK